MIAVHARRTPGTGPGDGDVVAPRDEIAQLEALADLHDRGKITDLEYEAQKRRIVGDV